MAEKWVYDFAEGSRDMRELLGGKGANVAEMTRILGAERVPAGFTITTEACVEYMKTGAVPDEEIAAALDRLEQHAGTRLGDSADPLLVSVRSGARESMPGMLDTVLNLGLNDESVEGLAQTTGNERFAWDSYRRFVQKFGNVVMGIEGEKFENEIKRIKSDRGVEQDTDLDVDALKELTAAFKGFYDFPSDPQAQLEAAIPGARRGRPRRLAGAEADYVQFGDAELPQQLAIEIVGPDAVGGVGDDLGDDEAQALRLVAVQQPMCHRGRPAPGLGYCARLRCQRPRATLILSLDRHRHAADRVHRRDR